MDNIGGIVEMGYCFQTDVNNCSVLGDQIVVTLPGSKYWKNFDETTKKSLVEVTPIDGTKNYSVNITVFIPIGRKPSYTEQIQLRNRKILVRYKPVACQYYLVAGDKENPLTAVIEDVNPSEAAGYVGVKITITGTMKHPQLPLR